MRTLAEIDAGFSTYDYYKKEELHRAARAALKKVAKAIGLAPGSFEIRSNKGGISVSGEVTLHGEQIYVQAGARSYMAGVLYRTCSGRKDYCGHQNNFAELAELDQPERFAAKLAALIGRRYGAVREAA